jgi:hypothetical protein
MGIRKALSADTPLSNLRYPQSTHFLGGNKCGQGSQGNNNIITEGKGIDIEAFKLYRLVSIRKLDATDTLVLVETIHNF